MVLRGIVLAVALPLSTAAATGAATPPAAGVKPAPAVAPPGRELRRLGAPTLTVAEIIERNVAARGGLKAWRKVETMAWAGRVEGGGPTAMPFFVELKRPNKTHFEITAADRRFLRIFDGTRGWRVRPGDGGAPDAKAFSKEENDFARDEFVIDGPLVDHEAKGVKVRVAGVDELEGRKAHLLEVTLPSGASRRIWIDAETFLELRSDRPSSSPLARGAPVSVYYRDYRSVEGLTIPLAIEIPAPDGRGSEKLIIEKVALNPEVPAAAFSKPATPSKRKATIRIEPPSNPAAPPRRP